MLQNVIQDWRLRQTDRHYLEFENQKRSGPSAHGWEDVIFLKKIFKIQGVMVWTGFM